MRAVWKFGQTGATALTHHCKVFDTTQRPRQAGALSPPALKFKRAVLDIVQPHLFPSTTVFPALSDPRPLTQPGPRRPIPVEFELINRLQLAMSGKQVSKGGAANKSKKPAKGGAEEKREDALQAVILADSFQDRFQPFALEKPRVNAFMLHAQCFMSLVPGDL